MAARANTEPATAPAIAPPLMRPIFIGDDEADDVVREGAAYEELPEDAVDELARVVDALWPNGVAPGVLFNDGGVFQRCFAPLNTRGHHASQVFFKNPTKPISLIGTMIAILCGFLTAWASQSVAQSLLNATARYSQLSDFNDLLLNFPDAAASLLANFSSNNNRQTVLVPSNDAFDNYRERTGASISSLSSSDVGNVLSYHTLQGALSSSDLQQPRGLISNTALVNETYDDREVLLNRQAKLSQVVFISSSNSSDGKTKIKARQIGGLFSADVRSGEGNDVNLEPTPGNWSGGVFYVVDG
ncbi:MAG: hypothetical protein LQ342_004736 [Letrouitia transgressa]|nr:MAG: hypothetical protein LQ342_004736 [Letrouitia transgressa]